MARPVKEGLDYFPVDIDIMNEDSIINVEMEHGVCAFGILMRLLIRIYRKGYYTKWTKKEIFTFSKDINVDINTISAVVSAYINEGFFNQDVYNKYGILTSKGIQKRYILGVGRRTKVFIINELFLLSTDELVNVNNKLVYVDMMNTEIRDCVNIMSTESTPNHTISTQSKVKESKVKQSKQDDIVVDNNSTLEKTQENAAAVIAIVFPALKDYIKQKLSQQQASIILSDENKLKALVINYDVEQLKEAVDIFLARSGNSLAYFAGILSKMPKNPPNGSDWEKLQQQEKPKKARPDCPKCGGSGYIDNFEEWNVPTSFCDCWGYWDG